MSQIIEATEEAPCLAMSLKLEMPVIRELLSSEEIQVTVALSDTPAMATGEATVEFLSARRKNRPLVFGAASSSRGSE